MIISAISISVGLISVPNSYALSCAVPDLGNVYEQSDYVFHGKVTGKNYLTFDFQTPVVTFEVLESFKGNATEQISVTVEEKWDYMFEDGFEYVVFVYREGIELRTDPCWPKFHALPSIVQNIKKLTIPDDNIHEESTIFIYESLSSREKEQLDETQKIIQEKRLERWDEVMFQRQMMILIFALLVPAAGGAALVYFRKKHRK